MRFKIFLFLLVIMLPVRVFAQGTEAKYFDLHLEKNVDAKDFLSRLNHVDLYQLDIVNRADNESLGALLDSLYLEVSDILDIHIYSIKLKFEVVSNHARLSEIVRRLIGKNVNTAAFYMHDNQTIYAAADTITSGILAHEIAHAVLMHYFVVPPPEKLQEIMCGYVEYSINKKINHAAANH